MFRKVSLINLCSSVEWLVDDLDLCHGQHLFAQLAVVWLVIDNSFDATLDDHLCAQLAGVTRRVDRCPHTSASSSLHNCTLLSVKTQALV
jgi:hypothetical protein